MVLQHSLGLVRVVRFQRAQDPGVVLRRDLGPLRDELEVADGQAARQVPEHRRQPTRTARLVDHLVELVVPVRLVLGVVGGDERLVDLAQLHELLVGERGGGPTPRQSRDEPEDPVVIDDVGAFQPSHERAPPRHRVDEALLRELDERFSHRHPAHPERGADLVLIDLGARAQRAREDLLAQVRGGSVLEARVVHGSCARGGFFDDLGRSHRFVSHREKAIDRVRRLGAHHDS